MNNGILKGFLWKAFERVGVFSVQFVLQIVLARILSPEHYGVLSIMIIFTNLANVFIQTGFATALVQRKDIKEEDYSSVLWVSLGAAFLLYWLIFVSAPHIGLFYNMPEIMWPMRVLALVLFPGAVNSIQNAKISKELDFKKVFYSNIGGIVLSGAVGIGMAYIGCGIWALVAQSLTNVITVCIIMCFTTRFRICLVCDLKRIKMLFSFGWKILLSALIDAFYLELENLIVGKKYNSGTLGFLNRGKQFPQIILNVVNGTVQSVMLPVLSREQDERQKMKRLMRGSLSTCSYILFPIMFGLASASESLISLLLTDKWLPCVPYLQIYCFIYAFYPLHTCNLQAIKAMGRSDIYLKLEIVKKIYGIGILAVAVFFFDSPIVIAASGVVMNIISWFVNAAPNRKLLKYSYHEQVMDILPALIMSFIMFGVVLLVGNLPINNILLLLVQVLVGVVIYLLLSGVIQPGPYKLIVLQFKEIMKNR